MRRRSLLDLARRLRSAAARPSLEPENGTTLSIKENENSSDIDIDNNNNNNSHTDHKLDHDAHTERPDELDENGNIVGPTPPKQQATSSPTKSPGSPAPGRKSLTFKLGASSSGAKHSPSVGVPSWRRTGRRSSTPAGHPERPPRGNINDIDNQKGCPLAPDTITLGPRGEAKGEAAGRRKLQVCAERQRQSQSQGRRSSNQASHSPDALQSHAPKGDDPLDRRCWAKVARKLQRMTNGELDTFLNIDDELLLDCLIDHNPVIKRLEHERNELRRQVLNLANFNYAREPDFVRDRLKLRAVSKEVARMVRHSTSKHLEPIIAKLNAIQSKLAHDAMNREEASETLAQEFLAGGKPYDEFILEYVVLRKETSKRRILADRLAKERDTLMSNILHKSLVLANDDDNNSCSLEGEEQVDLNNNIDDDHDEFNHKQCDAGVADTKSEAALTM